MTRHDVYRDGRIHVCARMCDTCIFRPGNLMDLQPGRVAQMVADAVRKESTIVCHQTLDGKNAACRGFYDRYPTQPLQVAARLGLITEVDPDDQRL